MTGSGKVTRRALLGIADVAHLLWVVFAVMQLWVLAALYLAVVVVAVQCVKVLEKRPASIVRAS